MTAKTSIEWTEMTWNPTTGCTKVSPGCKYCYAEVMAHRLNRDFPLAPNSQWKPLAQLIDSDVF